MHSLISSSGAAMVEMDIWWFNDGGNSSPNDTLSIYVNDGNQEELIGQYFSAQSGMQWVGSQFLVSGNVNWNNFKVKVVTADWQADGGHLVEAGIDNFRAFNVLSVNEASNFESVSIYPNPSNGEFYINTELQLDEYELYDLAGKLVKYSKMTSSTFSIKDKGVYLIVFRGNGVQSSPKKIIVY